MMWPYEIVKSLEGKGCGCPPQHLPVLDIIFDFTYVAAFWGVMCSRICASKHGKTVQ